jgi:hypothetical protein
MSGARRSATALLGSCAALALAPGPAHAGQAEDLQAQIDSLRARLDQLEKQKASLETIPAAAAADAVVGGDFPGSVKLPCRVKRPGSFKLPGSDTSVAIHGYIKADFIYDFDQFLGDTFANASIAGNHTMNTQQGGYFHFNARQTRFDIETRTPTDWGELKTYLEMDFYGTNATTAPTMQNIQSGGGNTSNVLRMRHAYGKLGPVLAGQTWSNFDDRDDLPEQLDFNRGQGVAAGRQTQLRYEAPLGKWTLSGAVENPNARIGSFSSAPLAPFGAFVLAIDPTMFPVGTPVGYQGFASCGPLTGPLTTSGVPLPTSSGPLTTSGGSISNCTNPMPDITGRIQYADGWGHVSLSGVARDLSFNDGGSATNSSSGGTAAAVGNMVHHSPSTIAGGVMLGTKLKVGQWLGGPFAKDKLGMTGSWGRGDERYFDNSAAATTPNLDAAAVATQGSGGSFTVSMKTIEHVTGQAWYQHWWTHNVRSSLVYGIGVWGYGGIPRAVDTGAPATSQLNRIQTAYVNLIWSPVKSVNVGLEFMYGELDKRGLGGALGPCGSSQCGGNEGEAKRLMTSLQYCF